jgi:hypothetical protein
VAEVSFGLQGFIIRWLMAVFLVVATYNPSGYSYYHWLIDFGSGEWLLKILIGIVLGILYATFGLATLRSLGRLGIAVWLLLFTSLVWLMIDLGMIRIVSSGTVVTIVLFVLGNVLAVGVSWSYVRARLSGQSDTNNVTLP